MVGCGGEECSGSKDGVNLSNLRGIQLSFLEKERLNWGFITDVLKNPNPTFDETHDSAYLSNVSRLFVAEFNKLHLEEDAKTYSGRQSLSDEVRNHTEVEILRRVWFTRIWALQELVMSPDP